MTANLPIVVLLGALVPATAALASDALLEAPWRGYDAGDFPTFAPTAMSMGDLDADGDTDVVLAREFFGGPGLTVLFNEGDGSFGPPVVYELGISWDLGDVELADVDLDGDLDAVATIPGNAGTDFRIAFWRNAGDGSFNTPSTFFAGEGPVGLVVGDFTGDGFPDVMTADNGYVAGTNATVSLLAHNSQTGFNAAFLSPVQFTSGDNSIRIEAADLDGDGDLDVAVGRGDFQSVSSFGVTLLFNDGSGSFGAPVHYAQTTGAYRYSPALALADMDNDGDVDVLSAAANQGSPSYGLVSVRANDGTGALGAPVIIQTAPWTFTPHTVATADLNGDGWRDILVSTPSGRAADGWNAILSNGAGGFHPAVRYEAAKMTQDLGTLDVDGDGDLDVLSVANDSSLITVHLNEGDGTFPVLPRYPVGIFTQDSDSGDLDHDGARDIVTCDSNVQVLRGNGDGTFAAARELFIPIDPGSVKLRDLDNDGFLDILVGPDRNSPPYHFATAINDQEGWFYAAVVTPVGASQAGDVEALDLDNDTFLDVCQADPGPAGRIYLYRNSGNGSLFTYVADLGAGDGLPFGVDGGDLDHDGNIDVVTSNALNLTAYMGNGDFSFSGPAPSASAGYPFRVRDLDADGNLDLVFKGPEPSFGLVELGSMMGFGDGSFGFASWFPGANGREGAFRVTNDLDVDDLDGDGTLDAVFSNNAANDITVFVGSGDGQFQTRQHYGTGYSCRASTVGDFTNDGVADVASVISLPPSGFDNAVVLLLGLGASSGRPADVNGDGVVNVLDLLAVLGDWGACGAPPAPCPADVNGDGTVNVLDLLAVLGDWS